MATGLLVAPFRRGVPAARPWHAASVRRRSAAAETAGVAPRKVRLLLAAGACSKSSNTEGEDAYFAAPALSAFGVADGVSAWSREGVDAGIFSRDLLSRVYRGVEQLTLAKRRVHLPEVLLTAYEGIREAKLRGSCTVLLGHVQGEMLNLLNLGDCAVLVLRPTPRLADYHGGTRTTVLRRVYQSSSMLHRQNMPLQLNSNDSDVWALEPFDLVSVRLRRGDVIIAGTDGLFDNVRSFELERMVLQQLKDSPGAGGGGAHKRARELADAIVTKAAKAARSMEMSEFSFAGKLDDIAVVVAIADHWTPAAVSTALLDNFYSQE